MSTSFIVACNLRIAARAARRQGWRQQPYRSEWQTGDERIAYMSDREQMRGREGGKLYLGPGWYELWDENDLLAEARARRFEIADWPPGTSQGAADAPRLSGQ